MIWKSACHNKKRVLPDKRRTLSKCAKRRNYRLDCQSLRRHYPNQVHGSRSNLLSAAIFQWHYAPRYSIFKLCSIIAPFRQNVKRAFQNLPCHACKRGRRNHRAVLHPRKYNRRPCRPSRFSFRQSAQASA